MKELYQLLNKLDNGFEKLKSFEKTIIYLITVMSIGGIVYFGVMPLNTKKITVIQKKINDLETSIKNNERAVENNEQEKILLKEVERTNESIKEEINNNKKALDYIGKKIKQQNNIKYSSKQWGIFYKTIQEKAVKYKINIVSIDNEQIEIKIPEDLKPEERAARIAKLQEEFRPIFKLRMEIVAKFKNIMEFLKELEKNELITKISNLNIANNDANTLRANVEINLWGIKNEK